MKRKQCMVKIRRDSFIINHPLFLPLGVVVLESTVVVVLESIVVVALELIIVVVLESTVVVVLESIVVVALEPIVVVVVESTGVLCAIVGSEFGDVVNVSEV